MKKTLTLMMVLFISISMIFAGGSSEASSSKGELRFGTGGDQGTYYGFGNVLAQRISTETDTKVVAVASNGSQDNIEMMDMNYYQLGFVQSDVMSYAYNGTNLFDGMPIDNFSTLASLYMEQVQIVTLNPNIKTVADLKGKTVSIGSSGSGVYYNAIDVLGAYGLTEKDITPTYQSFGDSVDSLQDGKIDAAFVVAGAPTVAVSTLASSRPVYLVSIDDEHFEKLVEASPYYSRNVIGKDVYGTAEDDSEFHRLWAHHRLHDFNKQSLWCWRQGESGRADEHHGQTALGYVCIIHSHDSICANHPESNKHTCGIH